MKKILRKVLGVFLMIIFFGAICSAVYGVYRLVVTDFFASGPSVPAHQYKYTIRQVWGGYYQADSIEIDDHNCIIGKRLTGDEVLICGEFSVVTN